MGLVTTGLCLAAGIAVQLYSYTRPSTFSQHRSEVASVIGYYERAFAAARANGWATPGLANDSWTDYLVPNALNVVSYERHHALLGAHEVLATDLFAKPLSEIDEAIRTADIVTVSEAIAPARRESPFLQSMRQSRAHILQYCTENLEPLDHFQAMGRDVRVFVRAKNRPMLVTPRSQDFGCPIVARNGIFQEVRKGRQGQTKTEHG
jgi:hypothetical protein